MQQTHLRPDPGCLFDGSLMEHIVNNRYLAALFTWSLILAGTTHLQAQRQMENLGRGLLAVKVSTGVFVSWRVLGTEWKDVSYNLYRSGVKVNDEPIGGASNFLDESGTTDSEYYVRAITGGAEQDPSDTVGVWQHSWYDLPVREIPGNYELNDASVGDLDGDGQYEIVVKRISPDMSEDPQYTHLLEAYRLDGTWMWTIDYGPNRLADKQLNFIVYDLDGDGKAEVVAKSSEGTVDGTGTVIGDVDGDGILNYRYSALSDEVTEGPEFLSVYDGATGKELVRTDYIPRDPLSQWGLPGQTPTQLAHRAENVMMAVIYANGRTPALVMCRGIYHRTKMVALDYRDETLTELWHFDSNDWPVGFRGQGNHNLSVADVDDDGRDEIVYGSMTVDDDGTGLYGTGLGHGDALHVSDMDPDRPGLEVWQAHENGPHYGGTYRDAATGEVLIQYFGNRDMGRACAGDITADYPGYELWGATECPIYSCHGDVLGPTNVPVNFMVWWDGDLLREFLDHAWLGADAGVGIGTISKYNGSEAVPLLTANGTYTTNYTKGNPCLSADILGDWREEVIWRTTDNKALRIYTTTYATPYRICTLMHDPQYRLAIAWQNNAYNQPPHPGYFIGAGMDSAPPPPMIRGMLEWNGGSTWDEGSTLAWLKDGNSAYFSDGDRVLFDLKPGAADTVVLQGALRPSGVRVFASTDYTFNGPGSITGSTGLLKAGSGVLALNTVNDFTGLTAVWDGGLLVEGGLTGHVNVKKFAWAGGTGSYGGGMTLEKRSGLIVGTKGLADTLFVSGGLDIRDRATVHFDLSADSSGTTSLNDIIILDGDLTISGGPVIEVGVLGDSLQRGRYTLVAYSGSFSGQLDGLEVRGVEGIPWELDASGGALTIHFVPTRKPARVVWEGQESGDWDLVNSMNWRNQGNLDWFVTGDTAVFNDEGNSRDEVRLLDDLYAGNVEVDATGDYTFTGPGSITGPAGLVKNGSGKLKIDNVNGYTGQTRILGGVLEVGSPGKTGAAGPLGLATEGSGRLVLDGGTLRVRDGSVSDRDVYLGGNNGTIDVISHETRMEGLISGTGTLIKTGAGTLTLSRANTWQGGTLIRKGRIHLGTEDANQSGPGPGPVTITDGVLSMVDDRNSYTEGCGWDLVIPEGGRALLELDSRCTLTGTLTGSGELDLDIPFIRSELAGDWSAFSGRIRAKTYSADASFLIGNNKGIPEADLSLGDHMLVVFRHATSDTIPIGSLTGPSGSRLGAGGQGGGTIHWRVGTSDADAVFDGLIVDEAFKGDGAVASIIKSGFGGWTLTGANTYTGTTIVEEGKLWVRNTSGSGSGNGMVFVRSGGTLGGDGRISGPVTVHRNGVLYPGPDPGSILELDSSVIIEKGGFLAIGIDPLNKATGTLSVAGTFFMEGKIFVTNSGAVRFAAGDVYELAKAGHYEGHPEGVIPNSPGAGLMWDTSDWDSAGILRVRLADAIGESPAGMDLDLYPNPAADRLMIVAPGGDRDAVLTIEDMNGRLMLEKKTIPGYLNLPVGGFRPGVYTVTLSTANRVVREKFIKQ